MGPRARRAHAALKEMPHPTVDLCGILLTGTVLPSDGKRRCYMMDAYFRTLEGNMLAASKPWVGDRVLENHAHELT